MAYTCEGRLDFQSSEDLNYLSGFLATRPALC